MTKQIKVLMVDDEERFRETTQKILMKKGFDTILAADGEEAIQKINLSPDAVILDIKMPGMDGHEALARIKKIKPDLPVIMLTGHGGIPSAREALVEGAFDYLSKPCDIDLLTERIKEAIRQKNAGNRQEERRILSVMIPIEAYTTLDENKTLQHAVNELKKSFVVKMATNQLMETGHRSILITGPDQSIKGILTIRDLLEALMPEYLSAPKPSLADSLEYSPMFWKGLFSRRVTEIKTRCIKDVMSPSPETIDGNANLMEAAYRMLTGDLRRLLVTLSNKTVGVVREQDLFFEISKILTTSG